MANICHGYHNTPCQWPITVTHRHLLSHQAWMQPTSVRTTTTDRMGLACWLTPTRYHCLRGCRDVKMMTLQFLEHDDDWCFIWEYETSTSAQGMPSTSWHTIPSVGNTGSHLFSCALPQTLTKDEQNLHLSDLCCDSQWPRSPALCVSSLTSVLSGPFSPLEALHRPRLLPSTNQHLVVICKFL